MVIGHTGVNFHQIEASLVNYTESDSKSANITIRCIIAHEGETVGR